MTVTTEHQKKVLDIDFQVKYNMEQSPTLDDVIKSLNSLKYLVEKGTIVANVAYKDVKFSVTEIHVKDIREGSLLEWLKVQILISTFGEENVEDLEKVVKRILKDKEKVRNILILSVGAIMGAGLYAAISSGTSDKAQLQPIEQYNTVNIVNLSHETGLSGDEIKEIVQTTLNKTTAKKAVEFVSPAKKENASIDLGNEQNEKYIQINADIVKATPESFELAPPETQDKSYSNMDLYIYASDQDSSQKGWAGIAPDLFDKRVSFELDPSVDAFKLHSMGKKIKADITVVSKFDKQKKVYLPSKIIIHKVL